MGEPERAVRTCCPTCEFSWLEKHDRGECPKCCSLLKPGASKSRVPGEVSLYKYAPGEAFESESGVCPKGGAHQWRFGRCKQCGVAEGYVKHGVESESRPGSSAGGTRRSCPFCAYNWLDKYGKNECPKCLNVVDFTHRLKTFKAGDSMERESGECPEGGTHKWRYGRCRQCGKEEGLEGWKPKCASGRSMRQKTCNHCTHKFLDVSGSRSCPKCYNLLQDQADDQKREFKRSDTMSSESGDCPEGGPHRWKFGYCLNCKVGEGFAKHGVRKMPSTKKLYEYIMT